MQPTNDPASKTASDIWNYLYENHYQFTETLSQEQVQEMIQTFEDLVNKNYPTQS